MCDFGSHFRALSPSKLTPKLEKYVIAKQYDFFIVFVHALGMDFGRFFHDLLTCKHRQHIKTDLAKKLTKHWPWRQNQGSIFFCMGDFSEKITKKRYFLHTSILEASGHHFGGALGSQNQYLLVIFDFF